MSTSHPIYGTVMNILQLNMLLEINEEIKELKTVGLTQEEINGYIDFFIDNWLNSADKISSLGALDGTKH